MDDSVVFLVPTQIEFFLLISAMILYMYCIANEFCVASGIKVRKLDTLGFNYQALTQTNFLYCNDLLSMSYMMSEHFRNSLRQGAIFFCSELYFKT